MTPPPSLDRGLRWLLAGLCLPLLCAASWPDPGARVRLTGPDEHPLWAETIARATDGTLLGREYLGGTPSLQRQEDGSLLLRTEGFDLPGRDIEAALRRCLAAPHAWGGLAALSPPVIERGPSGIRVSGAPWVEWALPTCLGPPGSGPLPTRRGDALAADPAGSSVLLAAMDLEAGDPPAYGETCTFALTESSEAPGIRTSAARRHPLEAGTAVLIPGPDWRELPDGWRGLPRDAIAGLALADGSVAAKGLLAALEPAATLRSGPPTGERTPAALGARVEAAPPLVVRLPPEDYQLRVVAERIALELAGVPLRVELRPLPLDMLQAGRGPEPQELWLLRVRQPSGHPGLDLAAAAARLVPDAAGAPGLASLIRAASAEAEGTGVLAAAAALQGALMGELGWEPIAHLRAQLCVAPSIGGVRVHRGGLDVGGTWAPGAPR